MNSTASAQTTRNPLMVAYWERVLNGLAPTASGWMYALHSPDKLHATARPAQTRNRLPHQGTDHGVSCASNYQPPTLFMNPAIANVFFRSGEIETWGRGIERTIPDKATSRFQKYRLTAKGRAWLKRQSRKSH